MTEIRLVDFGITIQVDEKYGVEVENQISDIRDLGSISSEISKPLFVEGSEEVNKTFQQLFNINIDQPVVNNIKLNAQLVKDGEILIDGFIQIVEITYNNRYNYTYQLVIFDNQINFWTDIQESMLSDLDFSQWDHIYNLDNIEESFGKDVDDLPYSYLLFEKPDNDYWINIEDFKPGFYFKSLVDNIFWSRGMRYKSDFFNSNYFKQQILPYSSGDDSPKTTLEDLEASKTQALSNCNIWLNRDVNGITFPNSILNQSIDQLDVYGGLFGTSLTNRRHRLLWHTGQYLGFGDNYIPNPCNPETTDYNLFDLGRFFFPNEGKQVINGQFELSLLIENDTSDTYSPNIGFGQVNGFEFDKIYAIVTTYKFDSDGVVSDNYNIPNNAIPVDVQRIELGDIPTIGPSSQANLDGIYTYQTEPIEVQPGDMLVSRIEITRFAFRTNSTPTGSFGSNGLPFGILAFGTDQTFLQNNPLISDISEGDLIRLNNWLPPMKQREFLKNLTLMYNLKWAPNPDDPNEILIEPRNQFYQKGNIKYLDSNDNFFVIDGTSQYKVVSDLQAKEVLMTYENDDDNDEDQTGKQLFKNYTEEFKEVWGQQKLLFNNENLRGVKEIKPTFSPIQAINAGFKFGADYRQYFSGAINSLFPKNNFRAGFRNVLGGLGRPVQIFTNATGAQPITGELYKRKYISQYATATNFDDIMNPNYDLNFGRVRNLYIDHNNLTDSNLYQMFWQDELLSINDMKMLVAKFYISNLEYRRLKMNDILHFEKNQYSNYYIINKIISYNAKTGEAKMELLTFDPTLNFRGIEPSPRPKDEKDVVIPRPPVSRIPDYERRPEGTFKDNPNLTGDGFVSGKDNVGFIGGGTGFISGDRNITYGGSTIIGDGNIARQSLIIGDDNDDERGGSIIIGKDILVDEDTIEHDVYMGDTAFVDDVDFTEAHIIGELDFTDADVIGIPGVTPQNLQGVLGVGNQTNGEDIIISSSDILEINGTADFTNATVVGLPGMTPQSLNDTLSIGNNTDGEDIIVDNGDTLEINGILDVSNGTVVGINLDNLYESDGQITDAIRTVDLFNNTVSSLLRIGTLEINGRGEVWSRGRQTSATNTIFGNSTALQPTTDLTHTTLLGQNAGRFLESGANWNTFIGSRAGWETTTGSDNTAIGYSALRSNETGNANVAIGRFAGNIHAQGDNNVFIGAATTNNSIHNDTILIGANATAQAINQTNQIVIGRNATGNGSNTTTIGNTSTVDTYLRGRLNIGTVGTGTVDKVLGVNSAGRVISVDNLSDSISLTYNQLNNLKNSGDLKPNQYYFINDRDIWIRAIDESTLSISAYKRLIIPRNELYTPQVVSGFFDSNYIGIYGQSIAPGSVPISSQSQGGTTYYAIWGGRLWVRNNSGGDGGVVDDVTLGTGWTLITTGSLIQNKIFDCEYNFENDWITIMRDDRGNVLGRSNFTESFNRAEHSDWGNELIRDNKVNGGIYNNFFNAINPIIIRDNELLGSIFGNRAREIRLNIGGSIFDNNCQQDILSNRCASIDNNQSFNILGNVIGSFVIANNNIANRINYNNNLGNILNNTGFLLENNSNSGDIVNNTTGSGIANNNNNGRIENVSVNTGIFNNSNKGNIRNISNCDGVAFNVNNGDIIDVTLSSNSFTISYNNNNGNIGPGTYLTSITEPQVNK